MTVPLSTTLTGHTSCPVCDVWCGGANVEQRCSRIAIPKGVLVHAVPRYDKGQIRQGAQVPGHCTDLEEVSELRDGGSLQVPEGSVKGFRMRGPFAHPSGTCRTGDHRNLFRGHALCPRTHALARMSGTRPTMDTATDSRTRPAGRVLYSRFFCSRLRLPGENTS
jgi:hypothetical protein